MIESRIAAAAPIRVAYVIDAVQLPAGGTEGQLLHLLEGMDRTCFEPTIFCLETVDGSTGHHSEIVGLDLHLSRSPDTLWKIWSFSRTLRQGNFDIVQTHFRDSNIVGVLAAWLAGTQVIISARRGLPYWDSGAGLRFLKCLDRRVTWFIANSMHTRDRYSREEELEPGRIEVIYNGLEPWQFASLTNSERKRLREELELPAGAPVIGIVANLRGVKGIEDFIQAAALVGVEYATAHFVIVGRGAQERALKELARTLGLGRRIRFLGARADVPQLLQVFDIGVLASHWESFSNSVLEYVAAGLPVVVTDVGGIREAIQDGREGFIVPAHDPVKMAEKICLLLAQPGGPRTWRKSEGIDEKFHLRSMVEGHENLYKRLQRPGTDN